MQLTEDQIKRQDLVDNLIFELIQELSPFQTEVKWDIDMIGELRMHIQTIFSEKGWGSEEDFYPSVNENGN